MPSTNPVAPATVFGERFWDIKEGFGALFPGTDGYSVKVYLGDVPDGSHRAPIGTPDQWINGLSYQTYINHGYTNNGICHDRHWRIRIVGELSINGVASEHEHLDESVHGELSINGRTTAVHSSFRPVHGELSINGVIGHTSQLSAVVQGEFSIGGKARVPTNATVNVAGEFSVSGDITRGWGHVRDIAGEFSISGATRHHSYHPRRFAGEFSIDGEITREVDHARDIAGEFSITGKTAGNPQCSHLRFGTEQYTFSFAASPGVCFEISTVNGNWTLSHTFPCTWEVATTGDVCGMTPTSQEWTMTVNSFFVTVFWGVIPGGVQVSYSQSLGTWDGSTPLLLSLDGGATTDFTWPSTITINPV